MKVKIIPLLIRCQPIFNYSKKALLLFQKSIFFFLLIFLSGNTLNAQQVTEVITDFGGFWKTTTTVKNPTYPNTSHNVLSFKYNNVVYSTGVNDTKLTANSVTYTTANFMAFPVASVWGTIAGSVYIALASNYDGITNGFSSPLPSLKIRDVLIDGVHGLNLGTGVTNVPASALINFPVSGITTAAISDVVPDILVSQIAQPTSAGDTLYFVNSTGTIVGNKIAINWTLYNPLDTFYLDLYTLPVGTLCDAAIINGTLAPANTTREIRLVAYKLSDFGITAANASGITNFLLKASGTSDPAFIAYNGDAFTIPAPVITVQPVSQIICPNVSNSVTLSVTATGASISYQWRKNGVDISGATASTYTIANVVTASAGTYDVIVSNTAGSISSSLAYLNISVAVQPSPSLQNIATGASATITVSANNATSYQWRQAGVNISGATSATLIINPVTSIGITNYDVQIINSGGGGCANILSSTVSVTGKTTLYSKATGNLNLPGTWGVVFNDGSGSSPVDFSRGEHTFIVKNNAVTGGDLTIAGTLDVGDAITTLSANTTLDAGNIRRNGSGALAVSATTNIITRGTSNLYFQQGNNMLKNLTLYSGNVTLLSALSITAGSSPGAITLNGGTLFTGDSLTFKSDIAGTANIAAVTVGAAVTGKVIVERYISARKAWRFLSIPTNTTQTISQTWQEGCGTNLNCVANYGIQITGSGGTAAGFDIYTATPSMKKYNSLTNAWVGIPNTTTTNIKTNDGYMIFIRGDRNAISFSSTSTQTVLRTKGNLYIGDQAPIYVDSNQFAAIGNPYASDLNMRNIVKTGIKDFFYLWDANLSGYYGVGAYQTFSYDGTDYRITPGGGSYGLSGSVSNFIAGGQAFFVQATGAGGSVTLTEGAKGNGNILASTPAHTPGQQLRANLYGINTDGSTYMADGILINYDDKYSDSVDDMDALKSANTNENLSVRTSNQLLVIERKHSIDKQDTVFLNQSGLMAKAYKFEFIANKLNEPGMTAFLEDTYLKTQTPLKLEGNTIVDFTVVNIPGSYAPGRFQVIFTQTKVLPLGITNVKAYRKNTAIRVEWKAENESGVKQYEVERSEEGNIYAKVNTTIPKYNAANDYQWLDADATAGKNYYRIKSIDINGKSIYSQIVKVMPAKSEQQISIYPNPVKNGIINLKILNHAEGIYGVRLLDKMGQVIMTKNLHYSIGNTVEPVLFNKDMPHGTYQLEITMPGGRTTILNMIY